MLYQKTSKILLLTGRYWWMSKLSLWTLWYLWEPGEWLYM